MSILIQGVGLNGERKDIWIRGNRIQRIADRIEEKAEIVISGRDKIAIPPFINGHTHAAMTLLRGYADDMPLQEWLLTKIWPVEAHLTEEDVYWGVKLACLEMIKTGTTFFNDMYWHWRGAARAVAEMGIRAALSAVFIDTFNEEKMKEQIALNERLFAESLEYNPRVIFTLGPHALYTVSEKALRWSAEFAREKDILIHFHLSETREEVQECVKEHGVRPVEYLERLGFLSPNLIACHCIWLHEEEMDLLQAHGVKVVHTPVSNMKLSVGGVFPYVQLRERGLVISLGTDGCASNNNLDMLETAKFASLLQKFHTHNPVVQKAREAFEMLTIEGARAFRLDCGVIAEGKWADIALVDLNQPQMVPHFNTESDLIYSANGSCIDTLICDGKVLMQNRRVEGEEEIIARAREVAFDLVRRAS
ncbi:MAG: amidohydrolase family protein [candidate division NC10 bacterium]|nr:amidohydrolase family protein [candidate division NC10 bacterium]